MTSSLAYYTQNAKDIRYALLQYTYGMYNEGGVETEHRTYGVFFLFYLSPEFYCNDLALHSPLKNPFSITIISPM